MTEGGFCCGQIPKPRKTINLKSLPENPVAVKGVELIYLGSGDMKIRGKASGLIYYVSDHRRRFKAEAGDVSDIVNGIDFIYKP